LPPPPKQAVEKSFIEDDDGFVKPVQKELPRASQVEQLGPGASVKDIAKNM